MKKLFKLKKWLTVGEAAIYLTLKLGEKVSEADVLRLALDGHLVLSVNFVNHANAKKGKVVPIENARYHELDPFFEQSLSKEILDSGRPIMAMHGLNLDDVRVLELEDEVVTLEGVKDLAMVGAELIDIENRFQMLTGGPEVTLIQLDGAFVWGDGDTMYQLLDRFESITSFSGPMPIVQDLKDRIQECGSDDSRAKEVLEKDLDQNEQHNERTEKGCSWLKVSESFCPGVRLPQDSFLVVRTEALSAFERKICEQPVELDKPISTSERTTLLVIIAALCKSKEIDPTGRNAVGQIQRYLSALTVKMDDDTLRAHLKKIPDAIERRMTESK